MSQPLSTTESQGSCPPSQESVGGVVRGPLVLPLSTWDSLKNTSSKEQGEGLPKGAAQPTL